MTDTKLLYKESKMSMNQPECQEELAQAHTTLLERVEKEVIGENDATHINGIIVRQNMMLTRNDMRAEQRTKLTQLREEMEK